MKPAPNVVYGPDSPLRRPIRLLKQIVSENWSRRDLGKELFWRNIKAQYRQTFFGFIWIFLPAIVTAAVWIFLYSLRVVSFGGDFSREQYIAYVLIGMILWQSFVESYTSPIAAFQQNRNILAKINFPREIIIGVSLAEVLFNATIRCAVLMLALLIISPGLVFSMSLVTFVVFFLGLILIGTTIGLLLVPLGALYLDIGRLLTIITPIWLILTPVIYPTPDSYPTTLLIYCNLASPCLVTARDALLGTETPYLWLCVVHLIGLIPLLLFSLVFYRISIPILLERAGN